MTQRSMSAFLKGVAPSAGSGSGGGSRAGAAVAAAAPQVALPTRGKRTYPIGAKAGGENDNDERPDFSRLKKRALIRTAAASITESNSSESSTSTSTTSTSSGGAAGVGDIDMGGMEITDPAWKAALEKEMNKSYFKNLVKFVNKERKKAKVYPPPEMVFNALNACPLDDVKVVVLGQDPYHGPGQAHGLSFSVLPGVAQPPSLRNMIKEAVSCCGITPTKEGTLTSWCNQGVLLLNTVLTVEAGKANSHKKKGWETFTDTIVRILNKRERPIVFLLWGKPSQEKGSSINRSKHCVITTSHPSPLGATKTNEPFTGSRCFARANEKLEEWDVDPIDWNLSKLSLK